MAAPASSPQMLGRYALYEKIASGGMASVHIGRLLGPVGFARTVAIKRMHPQCAEDPEFVSMFLDEARLAARIQHPNVVPTLDVVATEGELFLVMEYVPGESLARLIRAAASLGQRISPAMATTIMIGVLHGLHAAHEAKNDRGEPLGVVHRDVSPHNILVGTDGVARVLDFGVAKAAGRIQTTREGQLKGKLAYMAPEQIRGKVSRTSDVYAASVVLWETLTGKRLFRAENDGQLLDLVLKGCDVPPSAHGVALPRALDEVTMRGLSLNPTDRFPTARDMALALEGALALATASQIGDWVSEAAKDTLDERHARISAIESNSALQARSEEPRARAPSLASTTKPATPETLRRPEEASPEVQPSIVASAPVAVTDDMILTQLSSGSVSSPGPLSSVASGPRRMRIAAASAGLVLVGALVVVASRPSAPISDPSPGPPASAVAAQAPSPILAPPAIALPAAIVPTAVPDASLSGASEAGWQTLSPTGVAADSARARSFPAHRTGHAPAQVAPATAAAPAGPRARPVYDPLEHL